jgi:hypothetical protein
MRLSEPKIRYLADKMAAWLEGMEGTEVRGPKDALSRELAAVIRAELRLEVELEEEVERVLGQHRRQIDSQNMDLSVLRQKIKKQLAKERGIVL